MNEQNRNTNIYQIEFQDTEHVSTDYFAREMTSKKETEIFVNPQNNAAVDMSLNSSIGEEEHVDIEKQ